MLSSGLRKTLISQSLPTLKSRFQFFQTVAKESTEEVVKLPPVENQKLLDKWKSYWAALYRDYRDVLFDSLTSIRSHPFKSSIYGSLIGALYFCVQNNPDEIAFRDNLLIFSHKVNLVGQKLRNPEAEGHLNLLESSNNYGTLRLLSLGIFSIVWLDHNSCESCVYKAVCPHLGLEYLKFHQRIIDIGFLGRWWLLEKKMVDYDINPNEWNNTV